jgi:hypothetical protein
MPVLYSRRLELGCPDHASPPGLNAHVSHVSHVRGCGRNLTKEDYEETVVPLCEEYPTRFDSEKMSLALFRIAGSWVASRAFGVDSFHGRCHRWPV